MPSEGGGQGFESLELPTPRFVVLWLKDYFVSVSQILFPSAHIELANCAITFPLSFLCCLFGGDTVAIQFE
jgi:hypothetical protein